MKRLDEYLIAPDLTVSRQVRYWRGVRLALHLALGVLTAALVFPCCGAKQRAALIRHWSSRLLAILHIRLQINGETPPGTGHLLLANHISWLDIYALFACVPQRFVAKSEVASWPVIGFLCRRAETIFIERRRQRDALRVNAQIREALQQGQNVTIFPEGTTSDGRIIKPFRSPLLQAGLDHEAVIQPVLLRYTDEYGRLSPAVAYVDEVSLGESIARILATRQLIVEIHFLPARQAKGMDRRQLARELENELATQLHRLSR